MPKPLLRYTYFINQGYQYTTTYLLQLLGQLKCLVINYLNCLFVCVRLIENVELIKLMRDSDTFILLLSKKFRLFRHCQLS